MRVKDKRLDGHTIRFGLVEVGQVFEFGNDFYIKMDTHGFEPNDVDSILDSDHGIGVNLDNGKYEVFEYNEFVTRVRAVVEILNSPSPEID